MKRFEFGTTELMLAPIPDEQVGRRELERAVARRLVSALLGKDDIEIKHTPDGAPYIEGCNKLISVSHSRNLVAVAVDSKRIGIDIEEARPAQIARVAARVLSPAELDYYGDSDMGLLQAWTLKEALYKAAGNIGADFRRDIALPLADGEKKASVATINGEMEVFDIVFSRIIELEGFNAWLSVVRLS